ncbi:MAG: WG repeat-containing protein [bacterium]|nr:WG repeat-containing protein [bacterium]
MKKFLYIFVILFLACGVVLASPSRGCHSHHSGHNCHHGGYHGYYRGSHYHSSSQSRVLISEDNFDNKTEFENCINHTLVTHTKVLYYSDGTKNIFKKYGILNKDGKAIVDNLYYVKHQISTDGNHYFIVKNPEYNKSKYMILDSSGNSKKSNFYDKYQFLNRNKLIVKQNRRYGIVDFNDNTIADIKYNSLKPYGDLIITKYNGYFGLIDEKGNTILRNEYDKISKIGNVFVVKNMGKYRVVDLNGKFLNELNIDKIKQDGDYFKIKIENSYGILDRNGNVVAPAKYKKVRVKRNTPQVYENKEWKNI